jgi:L-ribulose-5-phosphate 4-epimerase
VLTAIADEFGGAIPCGGFAPIGGEEIGQQIVSILETSKSPAVLLQNHGVFTIGASPEAAVKAAIMVEDVAATVWHALQLGQPVPIPDDMIARLHHRYTTVYGQAEEVPR